MEKALVAVLCMGMAAGVAAQSATDHIEEYRQMLADGNPAELWEAKGAELWKTERGPKQASLEQCDLGKGKNVIKGAFVELPRYFPDTGKVQDLESRLLSCMETLQGFNAAEIAKTPFGKGEQVNLEALVAWIAAESRGLAFNLPQQHPKEKEMFAVGQQVFNYRAGPFDFSCASCHGDDNLRIRLQDLPNLTQQKGAGAGLARGRPTASAAVSSGGCNDGSTTATGSSGSRCRNSRRTSRSRWASTWASPAKVPNPSPPPSSAEQVQKELR